MKRSTQLLNCTIIEESPSYETTQALSTGMEYKTHSSFSVDLGSKVFWNQHLKLWKHSHVHCHFVSSSLWHEWGRQVWQKCAWHHEPTFFSSSLVKGKPKRLHPELNLKQKKYFCSINIDVRTVWLSLASGIIACILVSGQFVSALGVPLKTPFGMWCPSLFIASTKLLFNILSDGDNWCICGPWQADLLSPDIIPSGWLGSKHQLTTQWLKWWLFVYIYFHAWW